VAPSDAAAIGQTLPPLVTRVGVFVNAAPAEVARIVRIARLDAIQLHGDEAPDAYVTCGAPIIKAVSLDDAAGVKRASAYGPAVTVLVDAGDPTRHGGSGRLANWRLARALARRRPILLAGGLTPENVARALRAVRPWGIDLSSGVETRPGRKSAARIAALMAGVARADREAS
jgi:phosphoribosylanthranilate isomerase